MHITVRLLGPLRGRLPEGEATVALTLGAGSSVADALRAAGVPAGEQWNASIAGRLVGPKHPLEEGDTILVFAPIAGGQPGRTAPEAS